MSIFCQNSCILILKKKIGFAAKFLKMLISYISIELERNQQIGACGYCIEHSTELEKCEPLFLTSFMSVVTLQLLS